MLESIFRILSRPFDLAPFWGLQALLYSNIGNMINAGVTLINTCTTLKRQYKVNTPSLFRIMKRVEANIFRGRGLAAGIAEAKDYLPAWHTQMIKAGEVSGFLPKVLKFLSLSCSQRYFF